MARRSACTLPAPVRKPPACRRGAAPPAGSTVRKQLYRNDAPGPRGGGVTAARRPPRWSARSTTDELVQGGVKGEHNATARGRARHAAPATRAAAAASPRRPRPAAAGPRRRGPAAPPHPPRSRAGRSAVAAGSVASLPRPHVLPRMEYTGRWRKRDANGAAARPPRLALRRPSAQPSASVKACAASAASTAASAPAWPRAGAAPSALLKATLLCAEIP